MPLMGYAGAPGGASNAVAALTATIQAIESEKRNGKPP
jgi:hypothetical protein